MVLVARNPDKTTFKRKITSITSKYSEHFTREQLSSIAEISKSSYFYWLDNYESCIGQYQNARIDCANAVVGGDVRGAVGGVVSSWWSGLGAIGGAIFGAMVGTLVGSVEAAISGCD